MSEYLTIARPYAKAAFDFAVEHNKLDQWQQMLAFMTDVAMNKDMRSIFISALPAKKMANLFIEICGQHIDEKAQNFVKVLAENRRLQCLPQVLALFQQYVDEYHSLAEVNVTSALELSADQKQQIMAAMEKRLSKKVKLNCSVDPTLIAGAVIRTDDFVIDGSSRGQLARLATELQL